MLFRSILLGQSTDPIAIAQHKTRILKSGNPESVELYNAEMLKYYTEHKMIERMAWITENLETLDTATTRKLIEQWDQDQGRAMQHAEKTIVKNQKTISMVARAEERRTPVPVLETSTKRIHYRHRGLLA